MNTTQENNTRKIISVIVPTVGRKSLISCLKSLAEQTRSADEILIIDSSNGDSVEELCKRSSHTKLIRQTSGNLPRAYNLGLINAQGDIIAFIDDDAIADPRWLSELAKIYEMMDRVGGVGGTPILTRTKQTDPEVHDVLTTFGREHSPAMNVARSIYTKFFAENLPFLKISKCGVCVFEPRSVPSEPAEVDFMTGCNMSFNIGALRTIGGFDEQYVENAECCESDACVRLKKAGFRIILNPKSIVYHILSREVLKRSIYGRSRNLYYFITKNHLYENKTGLFKANLYLLFRTTFYVAMYLRTRNRDYLQGVNGAIVGFRLLLKTVASHRQSHVNDHLAFGSTTTEASSHGDV